MKEIISKINFILSVLIKLPRERIFSLICLMTHYNDSFLFVKLCSYLTEILTNLCNKIGKIFIYSVIVL